MTEGDTSEHPITITPAAVAFLIKLIGVERVAKPFRLTKELEGKAGCGQCRIKLFQAVCATPDDTVVTMHGVTVYCNLTIHDDLRGTVIDTVGEGLNQRIEYRVPNANACGCGQSFSDKKKTP
jgi:Fe-S cluster assembly iron-binding protein IscA